MIYTILNKAEKWFDELEPPKNVMMPDNRLNRLRFIDKVTALLPTVLTKDYLIFSEPEPQIEDAKYEDPFNIVEKSAQDNQLKRWGEDHEAWEQRRDKFEPIFEGDWDTDGVYVWDKKTTNYVLQLSVEDVLKMGFKLNPNSPWYIDNWNQIMES